MRKYIEFKDVRKVYQMGDVEINALNGVNFPSIKGVSYCSRSQWSWQKYYIELIRDGPAHFPGNICRQ